MFIDKQRLNIFKTVYEQHFNILFYKLLGLTIIIKVS